MLDKAGRYLSDEARHKMGFHKGHIPSKKTKDKISSANKGHICSDETKEKLRESNLGTKRSEKTKKANSDAGRKKWQDPEYRKMMIERRKGCLSGERHPMFGKTHSKESCKKMSDSHIGLQAGSNHPMFGKRHTKEALKKMLSFNSPNKQEKKLDGLLNKMYPGEWKFVGNGEIIIDGKCPDFININGQKKIIELYGERWHEPQEEQERIDFFKQYGYETLIIWCRQLNKSKPARKMIREFTNN